jgi:hypothetical protein
MFRQYDALADALDEAAAVTSTNRVIPKAASVLAAMKAGACAAAHLATEETFDTHSDHDDIHPGSMQHLLERLGIFIDLRQQQLVGHAQLLQQLAPSRALRGQVDKTIHGGKGGWR